MSKDTYRPGGWTVRQVVHHVADAHLVLYTRAKIALTYLLRSLNAEQFGRTMQHPAWGVIPIDELLEIGAWHGKHHTAHVNALRERSGW
jgi:hypothetical protein